jgi:hypothetical protein
VLICQVVCEVFQPIPIKRTVGLSFKITFQQRDELKRCGCLFLIHLSRSWD